MVSLRTILVIVLSPLALLAGTAIAGVPTHFSYQGMLLIGDTPYTGDAQFKFALVDTNHGVYHWTNDGSSGEPTTSVTVSVQNGIFSVLVGAPPMVPIDPEDLESFGAHQALRIWVDTGHGETLLGNLPLSSVLFAQHAEYANQSRASFTAGGQIWSQTTGFKFPDGTVQSTAATGGGGGGGTLDDAYDYGGPGAGRFITADSGPLFITGDDGLAVGGNTFISGKVGIGSSSYLAPLHIFGNNWDVGSTYGDLAIGKAEYSLRFGVATDGVGAGTARIRAVGGTDRLHLGAGTFDVVKVDTVGFHVSHGPFQIYDDGQVQIEGDFGSGQTNSALNAHNTNSSGIAVWAETDGADATLVAKQSGSGPIMKGFQGGTETFRVDADGSMVGTHLQVTSGEFQVDADGQTRIVGDFGTLEAGAALRAESTNSNGIALWATGNSAVPPMVVDQYGPGSLIVGYQAGNVKFEVLNSGEVVTPAVTITGGADLSEPFTMSETLAAIEPGSILIIDEQNPGSLTLSHRAYDPRVAGIASGAGGIKPGLKLSQYGALDKGMPVALSGRVYLRASTENGPIKPGDMITTSTKAGVGMRATDREKSYGSVVGKAMTSLESGEGLVLVLVGLQ